MHMKLLSRCAWIANGFASGYRSFAGMGWPGYEIPKRNSGDDSVKRVNSQRTVVSNNNEDLCYNPSTPHADVALVYAETGNSKTSSQVRESTEVRTRLREAIEPAVHVSEISDSE